MRRRTAERESMWRGLLVAGLVWMAPLAACRGGFDVPGGLTPVDAGTALDTHALGDGSGLVDGGSADGGAPDAVDTWSPPETCGDGVVDEGEQCDDTPAGAEDTPGDGCFRCALEPGWTCKGAPSKCETRCGDGVPVDGLEGCDDGNTEDGDGCSAACEEEKGWGCDGSPSVCEELCGDGQIVGTEDCDPGEGPPILGCEDCHAAPGWECDDTGCTTICPDGRAVGEEQCDDGNAEPGDGCAPDCTVEEGWACDPTTTPSVCFPPCGDGVRQPGEECDPGDPDKNDPAETGCTNDCVAAPGWVCGDSDAVPPTDPPLTDPTANPCHTVCGDGIVAGEETCDVGDQTLLSPYDEACVGCQVAQGWKCDPDTEPSECTAICGDGGVIVGLEGCDDGDTKPGDGCDPGCQPEPGWSCPAAGGACEAKCGDGQRAAGDKGEACDDGNNLPGDGCDESCKVEKGWLCAGAPGQASACGTVCGDGVVVAPYEACDDHNTAGGDGCDITCQVEAGWTCDDSQPSHCVKLCDDADGDGYGKEANGEVGPGCLGETPDCDDSRADVYPGAYELCDGLDNDCDGATDEEVTRPCSSEAFVHAGTGLCHAGTQSCEGGQWAESCKEEVLPTDEVCGNDEDEDCDGVTDEGCPCHYLDTDQGVCANATRSSDGACQAPPDFEPTEESCDGLDNDCDGTVDEGCGCLYLGKDQGVCLQGVPAPADSTVCTAPPTYQYEETACDGLDNDCDGATDEGCPCHYLDTDQGVCANATRSSDGACQAPPDFEPTEESCDGLDNDCDALTDEGTDQVCYDGPESAVAPGRPCHKGIRACVNGHQEGPCIGQVLPSTEVCGDGVDNDCNGQVDDVGPGITVCDGPEGALDCKTRVFQCTGTGPPSVCATPQAQPELCGPLNAPNGVDEDCDGVTDEGCLGCVVVVPEGSSLAQAHPFSVETSINQAIAQAANSAGPKRVCVAVPQTCAGSQPPQTVTYHETIHMVDGVDVQGGYEATWAMALDGTWGVKLTLAPASCVTEVQAADPGGHRFDQTITTETTLSGFTLRAADSAVSVGGGMGGDGGGGAPVPGGFPGGAAPESMSAAVSIVGARGAKLVNNRIYGGTHGDASYGVVITNHQPSSTGPALVAHAELLGNTVEGGAAEVLSVGVLVDGAEATIRACQPNMIAEGRCQDGWADKIHISAGGDGSTQQAYGIWLDGATGTLVDQAAVYATASQEAAAVGVTGAAQEVRIIRSALDAFGAGQRDAGLLIDGCAGASPWIADNARIAAAGMTDGAAEAYGILSRGACAPLVEGNLAIVGCSESSCTDAYGVLCEASQEGATGACDVVSNQTVVGSISGEYAVHAVGIGCRNDACRRVASNGAAGAAFAVKAVGLEIAGTASQALFDANWAVGGCGTTLSTGLLAHNAAARVQNSVLLGLQCESAAAYNGAAYGALVRTSASGRELDLHSNLLSPGEAWGTECTSVGLDLTVPDGSPAPMGPVGAFRNNILESGGCVSGFAVPLARVGQAQPPRVLRNNDLVSDAGFVYWDGPALTYRSIDWVNAMAAYGVENNISEDPGYASGPDWPHLADSASPCVDAGTPELAPATDMDGDERPASPGTAPDIGPDELGPGVVVPPTGL